MRKYCLQTTSKPSGLSLGFQVLILFFALAGICITTEGLAAKTITRKTPELLAELQRAIDAHRTAMDEKNFHEALAHAQNAHSIGTRIMRGDDLALAGMEERIAEIWTALGNHEHAIAYHRKALELHLRALRKQQTRTARSYDQIAQAFKARGEYEKAIKTYEMALTLDLKRFSDEQPGVATLYNSLGEIWELKGDCLKAIANFERGLRFQREGDKPFKTKCYGK